MKVPHQKYQTAQPNDDLGEKSSWQPLEAFFLQVCSSHRESQCMNYVLCIDNSPESWLALRYGVAYSIVELYLTDG